MKKYVYLAVLTVLLQACEGCNCPDDIDIGDCYLTDNSLTFVPYISGESIQFTNALGETEDLNVERIINNTKYAINEFCSKGYFDRASEYVDTDFYQFYIKNDSIKFDINQYIMHADLTNPTEIDTNFVDILMIYGTGFLGLTTDNRGRIPLSSMDDYIYHNSIQVVDSTFTNVYATPDSTFLYNKSVGVVGFKYHEEMYRFKKVN